ncbi:hypothetical protein J2S74_002924 [Evansella vedderi]|uniref:Uncharacterized protein n=1 Tax=Evansella vedderi TaxID=38282 RepID=A0ABT9ZWD3_9BACI|nr:hypothetical protein [Evansella vedderi]MDQ0255542.1 hypothetical protein [Evansella vedderi]
MGEAFQPIKKALYISILFAIIAIPVLAIIQWVTPYENTPFTSYMELLSIIWEYTLAWGDWLIIFVLTYFLVTSIKTYYDIAENLRMRHFGLEYIRWSSTPYIAPLHFYYLMTTPNSISSRLDHMANNDFYQDVVDTFRNRVYMDAKYTQEEPNPKPNMLQIVGFKPLVPVIIGVGVVISFFYLLYDAKPINEWFTGWEKFAIPFLLFLLVWVSQIIYAIWNFGRHKTYDRMVFQYFETENPKIRWREVFPDRENGKTVIKAWKAAREKKQRYYEYLRGRPIIHNDVLEYDNPAIAPFPYPQDEVPEWADDMEEHVIQSEYGWKQEKIEHNREVEKKTKGKVVNFNRGK